MTTQPTVVPIARAIRLMYAAMVAGLLLIAIVLHFMFRPTATSGDRAEVVTRVFLGISLGASALALLLRRRIPRRSTDESAELFWATASLPTFRMWMPLELGSLIAVAVYSVTGSFASLGVAALVVFLFLVLNPAYLERR